MLLQQQQIQQQQRNQQRSNSEKSTADSKSDSTGRHSSENLVVRESYLIGGTSKAPFNPQNQNQNQSQSQSLSCGSNKSISLQSSHSAITKNTDCNVNKSALLNDTNNSDSSAISEKESPAVKESPRSVDLISKNQTSQTSNSASTVYPAGNPSASLTVLSSAAAAAALNAQVTALPPNPKVSATASGGPSVATKSMIGANTANNIDCDDSLTVINILLPLYKDLMMSAALVSISKSYYFHRTRHSRQSSNVKIEGEEVYRTLAESVSDVDDAFSILARRTQPPVKAILAAADASSSSSPRPGRTVDLICAVCSLARHMSRPALKVSEKSGLSVKEGCNGLHAPDGRSDHCIQSGGIADASRMDMLLRCLTFLTTAIDCLESSDVADVRRAKRVAALVRVGTRSHSSTSSVPAAPSAVTKREPGHESQVDLNDKFEKVAESVCDSDLPLSKRNRIDTPEGRTLKKTKTIGLELTPRPHDHTRPIPMSTIFKELGPSGPRGITSSSRSHSSVKSYVSFTEHGHTTPIVGVRARGNSVDSDTAPPSVASTTDNWSTARRQHRLRGAVESAGDGAYRRATPFPLSALLMPSIDQSVLTATYNSLALLSNPEGPDRGPSPVKPSLEPVPSELPSSDFQVALLPGDLVSLLVDLAALSIALSVPVSYSAQSPRRHAVSSPQGIATFPASPPAPAERRIELLRKIVDLAQTVFRGKRTLRITLTLCVTTISAAVVQIMTAMYS